MRRWLPSPARRRSRREGARRPPAVRRVMDERITMIAEWPGMITQGEARRRAPADQCWYLSGNFSWVPLSFLAAKSKT